MSAATAVREIDVVRSPLMGASVAQSLEHAGRIRGAAGTGTCAPEIVA